MNFELVLVFRGGPKFLGRKEREKRAANVNTDDEKISIKREDCSQDIYFNEMESIKNTYRGLILTLKNKDIYALTFYVPKKWSWKANAFTELANIKKKLKELFQVIKKGIDDQ